VAADAFDFGDDMICTNAFRLLTVTKDGGPDSKVWAYWLLAWKALCSIGLLRFEHGSREAYHSHAFDCVSWVLKGYLVEHHKAGGVSLHPASLRPVVTRRETFHKVVSVGRTWVLTFRGPWVDTWREHAAGETRTLTHGRVEVNNV
jgi:hypothetical protein